MNRPRIAAPVLALLALLALLPITACSPAAAADPSARGGPTFGTLTSLPEHSAEEARAGVSVAEVEIDWIRAEPAEGQFDEDYLRTVREEVATFRADGRTITLDPTLHYTPDWVRDKPDARLVDDVGNVSDQANFIFSQTVRASAEGYLAKLATEFDLSQVTSLRVTSGTDTEVLYPANGHYWAFDANAQNGPDLPPTMAPNPAPGWHPGQDGPAGDEVRRWADWYVGALNDEVNWQIATYSRLGFRGSYLVLTPGVGVLPAEYDQAISQNLPPGLLGTGAAWQVFYRGLPRRPDLVAYVSSAADGSGGNDPCRPSDRSEPLDSPDVHGWSAARWTTRLAQEYGFAVAGENPGWHQSHQLDASYRDLSAGGMMAAALRQARSCGFATFYWAHDDRLWDGTVPFGVYAAHVAG